MRFSEGTGNVGAVVDPLESALAADLAAGVVDDVVAVVGDPIVGIGRGAIIFDICGDAAADVRVTVIENWARVIVIGTP